MKPGFLNNSETYTSLIDDGTAPSGKCKFARQEITGAESALHDLRMDVGTLSIGDDLVDIDPRRRRTSSSNFCKSARGTPLCRWSKASGSYIQPKFGYNRLFDNTDKKVNLSQRVWLLLSDCDSLVGKE